MSTVRFRRLGLVCGVCSLALAGCAGLPSSGPTGGNVRRGTVAATNKIGMRLVDLNTTVLEKLVAEELAADSRVPTLASLAEAGSNDVVGPGDVLSISIYEVGVGLFGAQRGITDGFDPSAKGETFSTVVVDREGRIRLPYAGDLDVGGHTPREIQLMIERAYHGKSQSPQALVTVRSNLNQTVFVSGDVRRPGRIELSPRGERLLDAIAIAGGAVTQTQDMVVRFTRGDRRVEERLDRVKSGAPDDLVLVAGDRIELIREPQTFVVLGATNKVSQMPFDQTNLTLTEAIARAGGPNDAAADPRAVFVFRYEPPLDGAPPQPVIYQLDMMQPASYFLSQRFAMRDKDVVYISNASINRAAKFVSIINQLFSPFVAARVISGN